NGNVATITDPNSVVTAKSYDANNNLILATVTGSTGSSGSTSLYTRYVYDSENHLRFTISAEGRVCEYRYNSNGTLAYGIDYPANSFTIGSTAQTETQMNTWVTGLSDRSTVEISKYVYDARGGLAQKLSYSAASSAGVEATSEGYSQTNYVYDQFGKLLSQQTSPQNAITYVYDGLGRLVASTDLNGGTTTIVFNDGSDTTTVTTAAGLSTVSTYNKAGELLSVAASGTN